ETGGHAEERARHHGSFERPGCEDRTREEFSGAGRCRRIHCLPNGSKTGCSSRERSDPEEELQDEDSAQAPQGARPGRGSKKEYGTDLVVRNTTTGTERTISDVLDYSLSKDAKTLAYTVASKNEETNGVYVVDPQSDAAPLALISGKGKY